MNNSVIVVCTLIGCADSFTKTVNKNAVGAAFEASATTEAQCETVCLSKSFSECGAFEFDTINNECWIHTDKPEESDLASANGINHNSRNICTPSGTKANIVRTYY